MRSTFFGLETARRALMAQQMGLETTAHNVANANTPGYSRQVVQLEASTPFSPPSWIRPEIPGQIGTGVSVASIQRMRDAFIDTQIRQETSSLGQWETQRDLLNQVELIYNEPSESGLRNALDGFWQSLQDLSLNPESGSARTVVLQRGQVVADLLNHTYSQLKELRESVNHEVSVRVGEINAYGQKIAALNKQIVEATSVGDNPNDLMDQRDLLITELTKLVDVNVVTDKYNSATVTIGGVPLVEWDRARELAVVEDSNNANLFNVAWKSTGNAVEIHSGTLRGLLDTRDNLIKGHMDSMTDISEALFNEFNVQHQAGFGLNGETGLNFFEYTEVPQLRVAVSEDQIAAAPGVDEDGDGTDETWYIGDGSNAQDLAKILNDLPIIDGTTTIRDYLTATISKLGVDSQHAIRMTDNQETLVANLGARQESVAGVSLDEEMVNMMKFQHAYNAAARVMTGLDQMYDTIINRMGLVGR